MAVISVLYDKVKIIIFIYWNYIYILHDFFIQHDKILNKNNER